MLDEQEVQRFSTVGPGVTEPQENHLYSVKCLIVVCSGETLALSSYSFFFCFVTH